jgi:protein TonB
MNRRRSSFFISFIVHSFILLSVLFLYNYETPSKKEQRVSIKLCQCMVSSCTCKPKPQEVATTPVKKEKQMVQKQTPLKQVQKVEIPKKEIVSQNIVTQKEVVTQQDSLQVAQNTAPILPAKQIPSKPLMQDNKMQTSNSSVQKQYIQTNLSAIRSMLQENFYYPLSARKRGIQGEVVVKFTLLKNSTIKDIIVIKSPQEILSNAAIKTIESLNGKLPAPSEELLLELPINYNLH